MANCDTIRTTGPEFPYCSAPLLQEGTFNINRTYYVIHPENISIKKQSYENGVPHRTKKVKMPKGDDTTTDKYTNKPFSPNTRSQRLSSRIPLVYILFFPYYESIQHTYLYNGNNTSEPLYII